MSLPNFPSLSKIKLYYVAIEDGITIEWRFHLEISRNSSYLELDWFCFHHVENNDKLISIIEGKDVKCNGLEIRDGKVILSYKPGDLIMLNTAILSDSEANLSFKMKGVSGMDPTDMVITFPFNMIKDQMSSILRKTFN